MSKHLGVQEQGLCGAPFCLWRGEFTSFKCFEVIRTQVPRREAGTISRHQTIMVPVLVPWGTPDLGFDSLINQFPTCQTIFSLCPHNHSLP